ncbi:MAG: hypothetical protein M3O01_13260 [Pseudomonadota bacterium]|nr:hypothetical protein [Pseudomonadota bacterium]
MTTLQTEANPFALMMEPEAIFAAVAASERLARLQSRICRPLDKPLISKSEADERDALDDVDLSTFGTEL